MGATTLERRLKIIYKNQFKLDKFVENDIYFTHLKINLFKDKTQIPYLYHKALIILK